MPGEVTQKMKGYIFEYYEYIRYTKESLEDLKSVMNYEAAERSILTFGEYDRLKINPVEDFARYRDLSDLAKDWLGNRQSIFLYELEDNPRFVFRYDEDGSGFWQKSSLGDGLGERDNHLFWALTEFPFMSTKRESKMYYSEMLQSEISKLKQIINKRIADKGYEIEYEIFGTLGTFGIIVLWFGNQFIDILSIVNTIKAQSNKAFLSARTLFSKNPMYDMKKRDEKVIDEIKGKAFVQMTLKGYLDDDDKFPVLKNIENKCVLHTPGEYDIMMEIQASDAYVLFENEDLFNHNQEKYQKNFLQTKVTLAKEIESVDNQEIQLTNQDSSNLLNNAGKQTKEGMGDTLERFNELCKEVRNKITEKMAKTSGLVDTMDSLICDYRSNVVSAVNENWAEDFAYTFGKNLECINELLDLNKASSSFLYILRVIMNNLKQQIFHITEANSLNLENPKCHLRYTGQEDGLLFCYMGIIKEILKTAYQLDSRNAQSEVVPIVTVDVVPIIESERYFDKSSYVNLYEKDQEFKILSLNLPHVSFYEIPVYFQYMYHEIFHYIVPEDREKRDYIIGVCLTITLVSRVLVMYFERELDSVKARKVGECLLPLIYSSVVEKYFEIHKIVTTIDGIGEDRDVVLFIADVYVKAIIDCILDTDKHYFLDEIIKNIGQKLNNAYLGISFEKLEKIIGNAEVKEKVQNLFEKGISNKDIQHVLNANLTALWRSVYRFLDGLKEISADIPMIELAEMPLEEYLIFYANCLKNKLIDSKDLQRKTEIKEFLRVGIILNYYYRDEDWDKTANNFIYKYIAKYLVVPSDSEEKEKLDYRLQNLKNEAEGWVEFFSLCIKITKEEYGIFIRLFKDYIEVASIKERLHDCYDIKENSDYYFKGYREAFSKYAEEIRQMNQVSTDESRDKSLEKYRKIKKVYEESMFIENIKLFQHFQVQESLKELYELNKNHNAEKKARKEIFQNPYGSNPFEGSISAVAQPPVITFTVTNFESFAREIKRITCRLRDSVKYVFGRSNLTVWYRGHENSAYGLIPSIMRKTTVNKKDFNYLAQYQRYQFGEFKFRADGAPEVKDRSHFSISDYLALMQHYNVHTNLMDWSEDAFTALYFALESVMQNKKKQAHTDAALWVFSPQLYNDARKYMIQEYAVKEPCTEMVFNNSLKTIDGYDGMIPNISVEQNEKIYDMFLLGNVEYESPNKYGYRKEITLSGHEEMAYLPLAVYTSRLNPRVRSQSGIFVAFNLYAEPSIEDEYTYIGLEKIQEYYMKHSNRKNKQPFLYKITIDKDGVREIADCLENMGINKSRIYPELSNIGDRVRFSYGREILCV